MSEGGGLEVQQILWASCLLASLGGILEVSLGSTIVFAFVSCAHILFFSLNDTYL